MCFRPSKCIFEVKTSTFTIADLRQQGTYCRRGHDCHISQKWAFFRCQLARKWSFMVFFALLWKISVQIGIHDSQELSSTEKRQCVNFGHFSVHGQATFIAHCAAILQDGQNLYMCLKLLQIGHVVRHITFHSFEIQQKLKGAGEIIVFWGVPEFYVYIGQVDFEGTFTLLNICNHYIYIVQILLTKFITQ